MTNLGYAIQNKTPQRFTYKYFDQYSKPIDLSSFASAFMIIKQKNVQGSKQLTATIINTSQVESAIWTPIQPGYYYAQFCVVDASSNPLYGEVLGFQVEANADEIVP